jgi:tetratricopeptide (TPR) repeat protein
MTHMGLLEILVPSMRRRRRLDEAAQSAAPAAMKTALPLVLKTDPSKAEDVDAVLRFFAQFAEHASDSAEMTGLGLAHVASGGPLASAQQRALAAVYMAVVQSAGQRGLADRAASFGLAGYHCMALDKAARQAILAKTVEGGCLNADVVACLRAELSSGPAEALTAAVQKGSACNVLADTQEARTAAVLACVAVELRPKTEWSYRHAAWALLATARCGEAVALLERGLTVLPGQAELAFLLALAHFREGRYQAAIAALLKSELSRKYPAARLRDAAEAAHCFCDDEDPQTPSALCEEALARWARTFSEPAKLDGILGPAMPYVRGRVLAAGGRLEAAIACFEEAVSRRPDPLHVYYAAHSLQLAGRWQSSRRILDGTTVDCPVVCCLRLRQVLRDGGAIREGDAMAKAGGADPTGLVRAKYAVLTGQTAPPVTAPPAAGRVFAEEQLRVELSAALAARDLPRAQSVLQTPLAVGLPAAEKSFFRGTLAWIRGEAAQAEPLLKTAIESASQAAGAHKCLADCQIANGDLAGAIETLKKVVEWEPGDLRSHLRLILASCELGREDGLIRARALQERKTLPAYGAYQVGRTLLRECVKHVAKTAGFAKPAPNMKAASGASRWNAVRKMVESADGMFVAAGDWADAPWYHWLCGVIASPPETWSSGAAQRLTLRPATRAAAPVEARWVEGLLKVLVPQFETAIEGAEALVDIAASTGCAELWPDVVRATWRTACLASTWPQCARFSQTLKQLVQRGGPAADPLKPLLAAMACRSLDGSERPDDLDLRLAEVGLGDEERQLAKAICHLVRGEADVASRMAKEKMESKSPNTPWFGLVQGLCALHRGDLEGLREARKAAEGPETADQWAVVEAAACALTEHPQAAEHLCDVIQRCILGRAHAATVLPLSGILSYVACQQNGEQNLAVVLGKLGPDALLTDGEAPTTYLRAAALVGMGEQARSVVEQNAALTTRAKSDLHRLYCHSAAQAIDENRYQDAYGLLTKAMEKE